MNIPMIKNSDGKESASFTMIFITFNLSMLWLVLFLFQSLLPFVVPEFNGSDVMAMITPIAALYFASNYKNKSKEDKSE